MQYLPSSAALRRAAVLALCAAGCARADLLGPDRFTASPTPRVGELQWSLQPVSDHRVQLGAAVRRPGTDGFVDPHGQGWQLGVWAEDEWRLADGLSATGGVRLGRDDVGARSDLSHARVAWQAPGGLRLRAGVEGSGRGAAVSFERHWSDRRLRLQAEVGMRETPDLSAPQLAFGLRLQSTTWWFDIGSLGATVPADPRQLRLGAHLVF